MKRNTIQRQLVIAAVRFLADHPTADEVYERITMEYPDISKGTVYRNLNSLVAAVTGFKMQSHDIVFNGLCPDCQKLEAKEAQ